MTAGNKEPLILTIVSGSCDVKDKLIDHVPQNDHAQKALSWLAEYPGSRDQTCPSGQECASGPDRKTLSSVTKIIVTCYGKGSV